MKRLLGAFVVIVGFLLGAPNTAQAITIGPTCGTCGAHNTTFTITFAAVNAATGIYDVTITAAYGTPVDFAHITAVGVKVAGAGIEQFISVSGPDGQAWTKVLGTLNNSGGNGCDPNNGEAFACSDASPGSSLPGPDTWVLRLDFDKTLDLANLAISFKARFTDAAGNFVGPIISEGFTSTSATTGPTPTTNPEGPVPEPASLFLLGSGLVAAHQRLRRRSKASKA